MSETITIFGLGLMGRPMAQTLLRAGWDVRGWNRTPLEPTSLDGLTLCPDLASAAQSTIYLLMVSDSEAVSAVLGALEPHLRPGTLVLDMGSSDPAQSRGHATRLAGRGIGWVDAPVSGGPEGATSGKLTIMAGGRTADFNRVRPILETLGSHVVHIGGSGAGHTMKIINQLIVGLTIEAVAEALTLAEKAGISPELVPRALQGGFADSRVLQIHGRRMAHREYVPGAAAKTQLKDLRMAQSLADEARIELPNLNSTLARYQQLVDQGDASLDHSALHKLFWPEGAA